MSKSFLTSKAVVESTFLRVRSDFDFLLNNKQQHHHQNRYQSITIIIFIQRSPPPLLRYDYLLHTLHYSFITFLSLSFDIFHLKTTVQKMPPSKKKSSRRERRQKKQLVFDDGLTIPKFISKLHELLVDESTQHIAHFLSDGRSFCVVDQHQFMAEVAHQYFSVSRYKSFNRQLVSRLTRPPCILRPDHAC